MTDADSMTDAEPGASVLFVGAGGHGRVVVDVAVTAGFDVRGVLDAAAADIAGAGVPILGRDEDFPRWQEEGMEWFVSIGDNWTRRVKAEEVQDAVADARFAVLVHPRAIVATSARLGPGTVVMAGAVINPGARIGRHAVVNTGAIVEHDCEMGDFSSVAPGAVLGGGVRIGENSAIGMGATVLQGRGVGDFTVVGAGAVVTRDIPDCVVSYGVPARIIRSRDREEPSL